MAPGFGVVTVGGDAQGSPPVWELPGIVGAEQVVTRSDAVVISVGPLKVYSRGLEVPFMVRFRSAESVTAVDDDLGSLLREVPVPGGLVLAVQYRDEPVLANREDDDLPEGTRLSLALVSGGSRGAMWTLVYWAAVSVDTGPLSIFGRWPNEGVPTGRLIIDADDLSAARNAVEPL